MNSQASRASFSSDLPLDKSYFLKSKNDHQSVLHTHYQSEHLKNSILKLRKENLLSVLALKKNFQSDLWKIKNTFSTSVSVTSFFPTTPVSPRKTAVSPSRQQDLIAYYQQKTSRKISEKEQEITGNWKERINNLLIILKEKQERSYRDEEFLIFSSPKDIKNKIISDFKEHQIRFLESFYKEEYLLKISAYKKVAEKKKNLFMKETEKEQFYRLQELKKDFFQLRLGQKEEEILIEAKEKLAKKERSLKEEWKHETEKTLKAVNIDLEKSLEDRYKEIDSQLSEVFEKNLKDEREKWKKELLLEEDYKRSHEQLSVVQSNYKEIIRSEIIEKSAEKALQKKNIIIEETHNLYSDELNITKKNLEKNYIEKLKKLENKFQENYLKKINNLVEKGLKPFEITAKMNYHKKLENFKDSARKNMEKQFEIQYKNLRRTVELEKISLCQFKANSNVYNSNLENQIKEQSSLKSKEKSSLIRKKIEPSSKNMERLYSAGSLFKEEKSLNFLLNSKSSAAESIKKYSPNPETIKIISSPLPPPSDILPVKQRTSLIEQGASLESDYSYKKYRVVRPSMTEEAFQSILDSKSESQHGRSISLSELGFSNRQKTQKKYEELLVSHYGVTSRKK